MMNWKIISYAMVGTSHLAQGKGCEDVIKAITTEDVAVMALADGAGSFSKAFEGATIATEKCSKWLLNNFDWAYSAKKSEIKDRLLYYTIRKSIIRKAIKEKSRLKEYSSTLLFVAIKDNRYIAGHIGDGVIGIITTEGDNVVLSEPERGEFANTNISSFFLMSDGSADCLYNQVGNTFAPAISKFAVSLAKASDAEVTQVNDSLKDVMEQHFSSRTNDDCSLIMLQWTNVK